MDESSYRVEVQFTNGSIRAVEGEPHSFELVADAGEVDLAVRLAPDGGAGVLKTFDAIAAGPRC